MTNVAAQPFYPTPQAQSKTSETEFKRKVSASAPVKEEELKDEGTTGIADTPLVKVDPVDGEYTSFPEIHRKTVEKLK
jgi:hypothetical protein